MRAELYHHAVGRTTCREGARPGRLDDPGDVRATDEREADPQEVTQFPAADATVDRVDPAAATQTTSSPQPGVGRGISPTVSFSGSPYWANVAATKLTPPPQNVRPISGRADT